MNAITHPIIAVLAFAALTLWSLPAAAGPGPYGESREEERAEARANMIEQLDLSDEQKTQVEAIKTARDEKRKELIEGVREANREARREVREQMKTLREETDVELKAVLTETQFERLEELRAELREEHRKDRPRGRRGGHRGRGK